MVGSSSCFAGRVYLAPVPRTGEGGHAVAWNDDEAIEGLLVNNGLLVPFSLFEV